MLLPAQLFASEAEAPRSRRPVDWLVLVVSVAVFVAAGWAASDGSDLDTRVLVLVEDVPSWLEVVARATYFAAGVYAFVLTVLIVVRGRGRALVRDLLVALVVVGVFVVVAGRASTGQWPDLLPEFVDPGDVLAYPVVRLALLAAVVQTPNPHLTRPVRRTGSWMLVLAMFAGLVVGVANVSGVIGGLALGVAAAALVHVWFGSPAGLPAPNRLNDALRQVGLDHTSVEYIAEQPDGAAIARAIGDDRTYAVRVHGRDASGSQFLEKMWRSLWYKDAGPTISLSGLQQVEHEAVAILLAERGGAPVPRVVLAGSDSDDNAYLVSDWPRGVAIDELDDVADDVLDASWAALDALHATGVAHGSIRPEAVFVDDGVRFLDLSRSSLSAPIARLQADVVSMIATHVIVVGPERTIGSIERSLTPAEIEAALPYLQDAVLAPDLRKRLKRVAKLDEITGPLVESTGVEQPELAEVRRVSWGDVLLVVFGIIAVNAIISQIAEIGFDTLVDELRDADLAWLIAAFVIGITGYYGDVISMQGVMTRPIPFGPTMLLQSAKRFIGLAVPSAAGRVALDVRYLQKMGVPTTVALAQGPLIGVCGFVVEVLLLLVCAWRIGEEIEVDSLSSGNAGAMLVFVGVLVVVAIVVLLAVPKWRNRIVPPIKEAFGAVRDVIATPLRLVRIFAGQLFDRVGSGIALAATLAAFGETIPFAAIVFVSVGTGLLAGIAPVPGGIGVAEATMTALLTGVGVPAETAFSVAITYRVVTSYLPPVLGFFSYRWLTDNGYL